MKPDPLQIELESVLAGSSRIAVVGIGDECSSGDRIGMDAARAVRDAVSETGVFLAGTVPESITAPVRRYRPDHILLLDAADMGARAGTFAILAGESIRGTLLSTHVLPLTAVMEFMAQDTSAKVTLIGIQPDLTRPDRSMKKEDRGFYERNLKVLMRVLRSRMAGSATIR